VRVVLVTAGVGPAARTAAQVVVQLARNVNETPSDGGTVRVIPVGLSGPVSSIGALSRWLVESEGAAELAGADLTLNEGFLGLHANPGPVSTVSCGTDGLPPWIDSWFRTAVEGD
jgi:hypothetical protein